MSESGDQRSKTGALTMLRHCLNPKVLVGLVVVGLVIWWAQPELIRPILPVLFLLACPLSMLIMMRAMNGRSHEDRPAQPTPAGASEHVDRATELRERLARARAEEAVLESELTRLEASSTAEDAGRERVSTDPSDEPEQAL